MHRIFSKYFFIFCGLMVLVACKKDIAGDPEFGEGDYPRIFYMGDQFPASVIIEENDTAVYNNLVFSPSGKVKVTWFVNGEVKSTDTLFEFIPSAGGEYDIRLEAEYNGLISTRMSQVIVKPSAYTPKTYNKVVMGYLSAGGTAASIRWNHITHLSAQLGQVFADGFVDITRGNANQLADELVARGHNRGIPVLLSLFGRLTPVDGWALYESDDMGAAIRDAVKRANVVSQVANYVTARKMDGVDVVMTDFNGAANYGASLAALSPFVTELKAALPAGSIVTVTVTVGWQHWEYPDLSNADWVNVHAFENGANVGPGAPVGQQSPFSFMVDASNIWLNKLPANKIVVGFPVFGLRYNELDANGNNASWGSYDYLTYRDILAIDPTAHTKDYIDASKGVYYNGVALIQEKAEYIKNSQFKGMYGWYIDADATDSTKSLFKAVNEKLN
jgi:hypothetical protein